MTSKIRIYAKTTEFCETCYHAMSLPPHSSCSVPARCGSNRYIIGERWHLFYVGGFFEQRRRKAVNYCFPVEASIAYFPLEWISILCGIWMFVAENLAVEPACCFGSKLLTHTPNHSARYIRVPRRVRRHGIPLPVALHDDTMAWIRFSHSWPLTGRIHWSSVDSPHRDSLMGSLIFSFL